MSATLYHLNRHRDPSGVSGEGDDIATICEFPSGLTVMHWDTETPSVTVYIDSRHVLQLHGHEGASELVPHETRLEQAYKRVVPWMLSARYHDRPTVCAPHPDHPDRLRLVFQDERVWRFWTALLDLSTDTASHEEVDGEIRHTVITPDGNVWLIYHTPIPGRLIASERFVVPDEDPLETFDREDRG